MSVVIGMIIGFLVSSVCYLVYLQFVTPHECDGEIIMHGDLLYLAVTKEDIKALENKKYAIIRLKREHFKGFSE